jgi:hypothetical protein
MPRSLKKIAALLCLGSLAGCGGINLNTGSSPAPNDTRPSGSPLVQAALTSQNGKTVSGSAMIFFSGTSSYTLRLEGISIPQETGLQILVYATPGGKISTQSLRSTSGSQNYTISNSAIGLTFNNIYIYSTQTNTNYASALFISQTRNP